MKPRIDGTRFGSITIDGSEIEHDVLIRLSGELKKRKKKLSKAVSRLRERGYSPGGCGYNPPPVN